ncbi:hypothetical protein IV102_13070 [bacterium]|nr:hypothetical protein [bacterium]
MEISRPGSALPQIPQKPGASRPVEAGPQEQVSLGQSAQDEAITVMQQMAEARIQLGHQLIGEVIEPAPKEFQEVSQATMPHREQVAIYLAAEAEGKEDPSQQGVLSAAFYVLATETKTLAQAAINAENRADFQVQAGQTPDRESLLQQELGFLVEANIFQGQIPTEQLQQILTGPNPEGEQALSAGTFVEQVRKYVPAEMAQQVTQVASQNPLMLAFQQNPELSRRFASALDQNYQAALTVNQGCLGYFGVLNDIIQKDMQAQSVLVQLQNPGQ